MNTGRLNHRLAKNTLIAMLVGVLLAGCSGVAERDTIMQNARSAFGAAKNDPKVVSQAQTSLYDAEKALQRAESADTAEEMTHLAYIAERQAEIAQAVAARKTAEAERQALSAQTGDVVLMSRERELAQKSLEVDQKSREAEQKAREAELARQQAERLLEQNRALQDQLKELQGRQTDRGLVLTLGDVLFETGKADLLFSANDNLNKISAFLVENKTRNVLIEGHTDDRGTDAYNMRLSEQRADSVRLAFIQRGVAPQRIITRGYGESRPIENNSTETGRQKNRRVEITILNEGEQLHW